MELIYSYPIEYFNVIIEILEREDVNYYKLRKQWEIILKKMKIRLSKLYKKGKRSNLRQPSRATFDKIIDFMLRNKYISKQEVPNSHKYKLTNNARTLLQMKILKMSHKREVLKRIYEIILVHEFFRRVYKRVSELIEQPGSLRIIDRQILFPDRTGKQVIIHSETEFDIFLSKLKINSADLEWNNIEDAFSSEITRLLYPFHMSLRHLSQLKKEYWKRNKDEQKMTERIYRICNPIRDNFDFLIYRVEDWEINRRGHHDILPRNIGTSYILFILGVTMSDLLNSNSFQQSDLEEAINILDVVGLIKKNLFAGDIRYTVADTDLDDLVSAIKESFLSEIDLLIYRWEYFKLPTEEEKERMHQIFGQKEFEKISKSLELKLHEHNKRMRACSNVDEYNEILNEDAIGDWASAFLELHLEKYKAQRKAKPRTKKEHLVDVREYHKYRKNMSDTAIENIPISYDDEGIEDLKMLFAKVIEKYYFLRDIVHKICPKIFEPPNEEIQQAIKERELGRQTGTTVLARRLNAITPTTLESDKRILKHVQYSRINGKRVPVLKVDEMLETD